MKKRPPHGDSENEAFGQPEKKAGWTRRGFLQSSVGLGALAVTMRPADSASTPAGEQIPPSLGPGEVPLRFVLNGESIVSAAEPTESLADVLLHRLGRTGTKIACDRGACGACTVLVDGSVRVSCMTPALDIEGRQITTVEGLSGPDGALSPLQRQFVDRDALQCGYCTPGFLMAATGLLMENPTPTRVEVVEATSGNLCRCAAHNHIVDAILAAAKEVNG